MIYCLITIQELVLIGEGEDKHFLIFYLRAGRRVECRLTPPACATLPASRNDVTPFDYFFQLFFGKLFKGSVAKPERGRASLDARKAERSAPRRVKRRSTGCDGELLR